MLLKIKRVPTVVSNYQKDETVEEGGCGRNCLSKCCINGTFYRAGKVLLFVWIWILLTFCLCFQGQDFLYIPARILINPSERTQNLRWRSSNP